MWVRDLGVVHETAPTASVVLAGAAIEAIGGPLNGQTFTADPDGRFTLPPVAAPGFALHVQEGRAMTIGWSRCSSCRGTPLSTSRYTRTCCTGRSSLAVTGSEPSQGVSLPLVMVREGRMRFSLETTASLHIRRAL